MNTRRAKGIACQSGFTLTELMVGLTVAGITLSVGVPSFSGFVANQTQTRITNDLVIAMGLARSEAIKQNRFVTVCKSDDGLQCNVAARWEDGWIVFANTNQANADTVDAGETVIKYFEATGDDRTIEAETAGVNLVSFRPTGTVTVATNWAICDSHGAERARMVSVDRAGRARVVAKNDLPEDICT